MPWMAPVEMGYPVPKTMPPAKKLPSGPGVAVYPQLLERLPV